jgi:hypothetical protein
MRDVFFHTQWCTALAMVAVQWPEFICNCPSLRFPALLRYLTFFVRPPSHADSVVYALLQYVAYFDAPHPRGLNLHRQMLL